MASSDSPDARTRPWIRPPIWKPATLPLPASLLDGGDARPPQHAARGPSAAEVARRRAHLGPNELQAPRQPVPALAILVAQFTDFMIAVLIAAAIGSEIIGDLSDTLVIIAIVILNGVLGFVQEFRAERAMAALRQMDAPSAVVQRDGHASTVSAATELVPG